MNKNVAIVALVVVNMALLIAVIFSALSPTPAYAQTSSSRSSKYIVISAAMGAGGQGGLTGFQRDGLYVVDVEKRLLSVVLVNPSGGSDGPGFVPVAARDLEADFALEIER